MRKMGNARGGRIGSRGRKRARGAKNERAGPKMGSARFFLLKFLNINLLKSR
jgi:hypothetical protein